MDTVLKQNNPPAIRLVNFSRTILVLIAVLLPATAEAKPPGVGQQALIPAEVTDKQYKPKRKPKKVELSYDDKESDGKKSLATSGYAVKFQTPAKGYIIRTVRIYGQRFGYYEQPKENFSVWVCDNKFNVIKEFRFPLSRFSSGRPKWVTLRLAPVELPSTFIICTSFGSQDNRGVQVHYDTSGSGNSFVGLPGEELEPFNEGHWMIRAVVARLPKRAITRAKIAEGKKPLVVRTVPKSFADDVVIGVRRIVVEFDQPMMNKSWSWVDGGHGYPKITGSAGYNRNRTVCTLPVRLEPGKVYWIGVNSEQEKLFQTNRGIAALPHVILFATKDRYGNPTPISEELLKKAKQINSQTPQKSEDTEKEDESGLSKDAKKTGQSDVSAKMVKEPGMLQNMIDSARRGGTVVVPDGIYTEPIVIDKSLTLRGQSRKGCVFEVTDNGPAIYIDTKGRGKVKIEAMTIKWQLATSEENIENPFALGVVDSEVEVVNCSFIPLGNFSRCPIAVKAEGFTNLVINACRFEGFTYTISYGEGATGMVQDCLVIGSGHQGISLYSGAEVKIFRNVVTGSGYYGIRSTGGILEVRDNLIINNANRGIYLGNKSALGTISNNVILANSTGIDAFAHSNVKVENNVIGDSDFAGLVMRETTSIMIRDNIFYNNAKGWVLLGGKTRGRNKAYRNTFWQNTVDDENLRKSRNSIVSDSQFVDPNNGDFSLQTGPAKRRKQGLRKPEVLKELWQRWQNRENKDEPFVSVGIDSAQVKEESINEAVKIDAENLNGQGWRLFSQNSLVKAERVFKLAVSLDPTNANAWNGLGWSQYNMENYFPAKSSFEKCLEIDPQQAGALNGMGWIIKGQGQIYRAIEYWEKAVEANPRGTNALNGLTMTLMEMKDYNKAIKYYQMWLAIEPGNANVRAGLKQAYSLRRY